MNDPAGHADGGAPHDTEHDHLHGGRVFGGTGGGTRSHANSSQHGSCPAQPLPALMTRRTPAPHVGGSGQFCSRAQHTGVSTFAPLRPTQCGHAAQPFSSLWNATFAPSPHVVGAPCAQESVGQLAVVRAGA